MACLFITCLRTLHQRRTDSIYSLESCRPSAYRQVLYLILQNIIPAMYLGTFVYLNLVLALTFESSYSISANSFLPWIVSPFNSFRGNYSIYEVKNYLNAETIWKIPHFPLLKKNSFRGNYSRKYGKSCWSEATPSATHPFIRSYKISHPPLS